MFWFFFYFLLEVGFFAAFVFIDVYCMFDRLSAHRIFDRRESITYIPSTSKSSETGTLVVSSNRIWVFHRHRHLFNIPKPAI